MTLDQKIQIWNAIGTWLAGLATLAAVIVALYLSKQADRLKIELKIGLRKVIQGNDNKPEDCVCYEVNRPVFLGQMVECIHAAAPVPRRS